MELKEMTREQLLSQRKMVEKAKSLGASDYIVKPFDSTEVLSKVQAVLGK